MKAPLTFFYALYLLVLSVVPCGDVHAKPVLWGKSNSPTQATPAHHIHAEMLCSPFCACACCHTVVATPPAVIGVEIAGPVALHADWNNVRPPAVDAVPAGSIWQPPKAGEKF